jgi:hypothetical protein
VCLAGHRCLGVPGTLVGWEVRSVATELLCPRGPRRTLGHPQRENPGDRGGKASTALRPPSTAGSKSGLSMSGHRFRTGPRAPACFGHDVTSDFFLSLSYQKTFSVSAAEMSSRLFVVFFPAFLTSCQSTTEKGSFQLTALGHWSKAPAASSGYASFSGSPRPRVSPAHLPAQCLPGCASLLGMRHCVIFMRRSLCCVYCRFLEGPRDFEQGIQNDLCRELAKSKKLSLESGCLDGHSGPNRGRRRWLTLRVARLSWASLRFVAC